MHRASGPLEVFDACVPLALQCPERMKDAVATVLEGEYECGYSGHRLRILDIGANVAMLRRNTERLANVEVHQCAIFPSTEARLPLRSRYSGDGESGLVENARETFVAPEAAQLHMVQVVHPRELPPCDVLKIDVEGAEASIIDAFELREVSLVLLEYQNDANRRRIKQRLEGDFSIVFEDSHSWTPLLQNPQYRRELRGDHFGHLFFVNRRANLLQKMERGPGRTRPPSLRELVRDLPFAIRASLARRWRESRSPRVS